MFDRFYTFIAYVEFCRTLYLKKVGMSINSSFQIDAKEYPDCRKMWSEKSSRIDKSVLTKKAAPESLPFYIKVYWNDYFLNLFLNPANPIIPAPRRNTVAGMGVLVKPLS